MKCSEAVKILNTNMGNYEAFIQELINDPKLLRVYLFEYAQKKQ